MPAVKIEPTARLSPGRYGSLALLGMTNFEEPGFEPVSMIYPLYV
jgi:hypothetical protein